mmetsp:Transcript_5723/g.7941  ORF Transcript_5723/g.7941 Transcript_5723/m.7941 type:complete len:446 (+) Transcript_5723:46-1383(+)
MNMLAIVFLIFFQFEFAQSIYVDPQYKDFVRITDDGLDRGSISAYDNEWKKTFIDGLKNPRLMTTSSPVDFWFRCVDKKVRGYFFIDSLAQHPTENFNDLVYGPDDMKRRFKLLVDDKPLPYDTWHSGGDFYIDVSQKPANSEIIISVEGWLRYTSFSLSKCTKSLPQPAEPEYLMHVHTYDHPKSIKLNKLYPSGIAHHLVYHRCALNVTKYELIIQPEHLQRYLRNPHLAKFAQQGWLKFVLKSDHPSRMNLPFIYNYHQGIYENQALLQHWKTNVRIFFFNPDEFVAYNPALTFAEFDQKYLGTRSNVAFDRYMTFCVDCKQNSPELPQLSFTDRRYKLTEKLQHPKLFIDPNENGCILVHWSQCGKPETRLSNETAYILHFENLYKKRWSNATTMGFGRIPLDAWPFMDKTRVPLMTCDPQRAYDFKSRGSGEAVLRASFV